MRTPVGGAGAVPVPAAWVIVTVRPATVNVPVRLAGAVFRDTV
jgi:hypothetical protein